MREYGVEVCSPECGACRVEEIEQLEGEPWCGWVLEKYGIDCIRPTLRVLLYTEGNPSGLHCPVCGTLIGEDGGGFWREHHEDVGLLLVAARNALHFFAGAMGQCPMEYHEDFSQVPWCEVESMEDLGDCSRDAGECWLEGADGWCGVDMAKLDAVADAALKVAEEGEQT